MKDSPLQVLTVPEGHLEQQFPSQNTGGQQRSFQGGVLSAQLRPSLVETRRPRKPSDLPEE